MTPAESANDTIVAVVTPPGRGGVGLVRLSGPDAYALATRLFASSKQGFTGFRPYRLHHGTLLDASGRPLDDGLAAHMPGPDSYTGEDVVEFNCHGSPAVLRALVAAALALGARLAGPGEFTKRAFLAGRIDLSQAQAVAELVAADTLAGAGLALTKLSGALARRVGELRQTLLTLRARLCLAVDFPEDEVECLDVPSFLQDINRVITNLDELSAAHSRARPFREGERVVLAGPVNAGKSSLLNALIGRERAIVCEIPGTTRDFLEEQLDLEGLPIRLTDTAGLRDTDERIEREGLSRSLVLIEQSGLTLLVIDGSQPFDPSSLTTTLRSASSASAQQSFPHLDPARTLVVVNKRDLPPAAPFPGTFLEQAGFETLCVSAKTGHGLTDLCGRIRSRLLAQAGSAPDSAPAPNDRELALITLARDELAGLAADLQTNLPPDLLSACLDTACAHLDSITGAIAPQEVLDAIFDKFCIGK